MADRTQDARRGRTRRRSTAGAVLAGLLLASACAAPRDTADDITAGEVAATLDRRAAAVMEHDTDAYLAALDPRAGAFRAAQRTELRNLADVPLESWAYKVNGVSGTGTGRVSAEVELRYRFKGYDTAPMSSSRTVELVRRGADDSWYIAADRAGEGTPGLLWQQGDVEVVRGTHSLVLGVGRRAEELRRIADTADRAVPAVSGTWPEPWAGRVVVLVPASVEAMAGLLGSPAASYRGIAAVTTGEVGGSGRRPADRVIVNPQAYGMLGEFGQRVVLTHETTHVATRSHTSAATPVWLSEGFADLTAYRRESRTARELAPELAASVRRNDLPARLPADEDFGFGGDAAKLARAYESGWLACELIVRDWGEEELIAFYKAVGARSGRDGAVEHALQSVLGTTPQDFTARWRDYLRDRLG
ncbi:MULTISPECIES: hypothetical protein [Streptomyces]|uniref:Lipoprotein n=1 Tax=Streptomyces clavifer TaxID=68188 RepID=A0ABS4VD14_9ACTN|nr:MULTISPECIES: hypothetical protein [Streptomyces]MBP2361813.1 hypothetical protein [Streptomyces clavifer]MDX2748245.1 hypothetical protein [Streptomyces sp. NRRL_B-2557]MDX3062458.1 hypothetical protein [Streptomyces sp. ND04-05B]WRY81670.1 hypothetical protein OG388_10740 [Streptomyces clavifer]WUC27431.1 hypothetical protein OG927_08655 [Streptomyces clavifer]